MTVQASCWNSALVWFVNSGVKGFEIVASNLNVGGGTEAVVGGVFVVGFGPPEKEHVICNYNCLCTMNRNPRNTIYLSKVAFVSIMIFHGCLCYHEVKSGKCEHTDDNNRVSIKCDIASRGVDCSNCQGLYDITCRRDVFRWSCLIEYKLHLYDRCVSNGWRTEKQIAFMMQQFDLHQSWILCAEFIAWHTDYTIHLKRVIQLYILFDPIQLNIDHFNWPSHSCIVWKAKHYRYKYKCSSLSQMSHDSLNSNDWQWPLFEQEHLPEFQDISADEIRPIFILKDPVALWEDHKTCQTLSKRVDCIHITCDLNVEERMTHLSP